MTKPKGASVLSPKFEMAGMALSGLGSTLKAASRTASSEETQKFLAEQEKAAKRLTSACKDSQASEDISGSLVLAGLRQMEEAIIKQRGLPQARELAETVRTIRESYFSEEESGLKRKPQETAAVRAKPGAETPMASELGSEKAAYAAVHTVDPMFAQVDILLTKLQAKFDETIDRGQLSTDTVLFCMQKMEKIDDLRLICRQSSQGTPDQALGVVRTELAAIHRGLAAKADKEPDAAALDRTVQGVHKLLIPKR